MKFEYYGEDSDIIDEDMIGNPRHDLAIVGFIISSISVILVVTKLSGFLAAASGLFGTMVSLRALRYNRTSYIARAGLIIGLIGMVIGALLFVSCISCTACTLRRLF